MNMDNTIYDDKNECPCDVYSFMKTKLSRIVDYSIR